MQRKCGNVAAVVLQSQIFCCSPAAMRFFCFHLLLVLTLFDCRPPFTAVPIRLVFTSSRYYFLICFNILLLSYLSVVAT